jgi:dolichol-phosphate mannosyltransferase
MKCLIVLPTYNERENLPSIVPAILAQGAEFDVLVVDDNSPDGTGQLADELAAADSRVSVLHRDQKAGLGEAYRAGFREVLRHPTSERIVQMDCDFSHDPEELAALLAPIDNGYDLALGSRYIPGGSTPGWGARRQFVSKAGNFVARTVLSLPYRDMTGGFKAWRRETLAALDLDGGYAQGYGFQIEMTWQADRQGRRIVEVPITFRERTAGISKMTASIALEALLMVLKLRMRGPNHRKVRRPESSI